LALSKWVRIEAYVACPPTSRCRQMIAMLEHAVRRHPGEVRLVVFERGAAWPEEPSRALKYAFSKGSTVPMCFVDGRFVVGGKLPNADEIEEALAEALARRAAARAASGQAEAGAGHRR
jgi:hypothetical protein